MLPERSSGRAAVAGTGCTAASQGQPGNDRALGCDWGRRALAQFLSRPLLGAMEASHIPTLTTAPYSVSLSTPTSLVAQMVKGLPAMRETRVRSLG